MPRYAFGGDIHDLIARPDFAAGGWLKYAPNETITFYTSAVGGSAVTDFVLDTTGTGTFSQPSSTITVRDTGYLPAFQGPNDVTVLYYDPDPTDDDVQRVRLESWDAGFAAIPTATESTTGLARKSTSAEAAAGVSDVGFLTPLKMATSNLFMKAKASAVSLFGAGETAFTYTVIDDGSSQAGWPDRAGFLFGAVKTGRFNRYGELRSGAARANTVPLRVENLNTAPTANLIEAGTGTGLTQFAVRADGSIIAPNVGQKLIVLGASDPVPAGTADLTLIARLSGATATQQQQDPGGGETGGGGGTSQQLLRDHPHEGTAGLSPTAAAEGYASSTGQVATYVSGGIVGSTALQWQAGSVGSLTDTFPAQSSDLYVRFYYRQDANGSGNTTPIWLTSINAEIRVRTSEVVVTDTFGTSSVSSEPLTKPPVGSWWRGLWRIGETDTTLSIWTTPAATGEPDYTTTFTWPVAKARPTNLQVGQKVLTGGILTLDSVAVGTTPIGPAA